ncbi:carbohydrate binding domain-containing protein [Paenibacillus sp.]|uniref:carbohydrate binding domain-containing protein n=1 Tax=Paenibacillus sp. TaxID=58172 RepID=UPI0028126726|nr:carbohydrate binding domain-containing protein [Paenibacillus sp.]
MFESVIHHGKKFASVVLSAALIGAVALPAPPDSNALAADAVVVPRTFSVPEDLGTQVTAPNTFNAAFGAEDGKDVMYTTVAGSAVHSAIFSVVDLDTNRVVRELPLSGGGQSWGHAIDSQGNVYTVAGNVLYAYSPVTKHIRTIGAVPEATSLYSIVVDESDRVYGGGYPSGKVFVYDPAQDKLTLLTGQLAEAQQYVRGIAYYDGYLYAGTGTKGGLFRIDPADGAKTQIPFPENALFSPADAPTVYSMNAVGHYLFVMMSTSPTSLFIYDLENGRWAGIVENYRGLYVSPEKDGKVYFPADGELKSFDLTTEEVAGTGIVFGTYIRTGAWVELDDQERFPGMSLVTVTFNGAPLIANVETGVATSFPSLISGTPVSIQSIATGPDGLIYSTGYQGTKGARYDIDTGEIEHFRMGQAEGMIAWGDKVVFGEYPGGYIYELDTKQPIGDDNPKSIYHIGGKQDRPFALAVSPDRLFIGTIPKTGELGGALTVYDGTEWKVFAEMFQPGGPLENQSVMGLAYHDGMLYGSTTVWGGLGIDPAADKAKVFVWDVAEERLVTAFSPDVAQASGVAARSIGGLSVGPDGLLWAAAYGTIFAMDPADGYRVVKQKEMYPTNWDFSHYWVPVKLLWDPKGDGVLYTTLGSTVTAVDTNTMAHAQVPGTKTNLMTIGPDGNLYFNTADMLKKITVTEESPPLYADVAVPLVNSGFEARTADGTIPGWDDFGQSTATGYSEISGARASEGESSLRIFDSTDRQEVGVISLPFAVEPGAEYKVSADIYLASGRTIAAMRYYDANGQEIKLTPAPAAYHQGSLGAWSPANFSSIAPEGAVAGRIVLFCSLGWATDAYYDNVKVTKRVPFELPPEQPVLGRLKLTNPGFESAGADGAIPGWTQRNLDKYTADAYVRLSQDTVKSGTQSLLLYDNSTTIEVAAESDFIPVVGGKTYTASVDVYRGDNPPGRSSNRPILQTRYYDANKVMLSTSAAVNPGPWSKEATVPLGRWGTETLTNTAHAAAKYMRVFMVVPATYVANAYIDNVQVSTALEPSEVASFRMHAEPYSHLAAGGDVVFQAAASEGSRIVVEENGAVVADVPAVGLQTPVSVTVPSPAAGVHGYTAYAVKGISQSAPYGISTTIHALDDLALVPDALELLTGETKPIAATAWFGPLAVDVVPEVAVASGDAVSVSGAAVTGVSAGEAVLSVAYGGMQKTLRASVSQGALASIRIALPKSTIGLGESVTVQVYGTYDNPFDAAQEEVVIEEGVTLTAEPAGVVSIQGSTVTGASTGSAVLHAEYEGLSASAAIAVERGNGPPDPEAPKLAAIRLDLSETRIGVGQRVTAQVFGVYAGASKPVALTEDVALFADDSGVANVDGLTLTGIDEGHTLIRAEYGGKTATASIVVRNRDANGPPDSNGPKRGSMPSPEEE